MFFLGIVWLFLILIYTNVKQLIWNVILIVSFYLNFSYNFTLKIFTDIKREQSKKILKSSVNFEIENDPLQDFYLTTRFGKFRLSKEMYSNGQIRLISPVIETVIPNKTFLIFSFNYFPGNIKILEIHNNLLIANK